MGLYDTIKVYMRCPYCGHHRIFYAQTKDLGENMHTYDALSEDWEDKESFGGKKLRRKLPVFRRFPKDKSAKVWETQAEEAEAAAEVPDEFKNSDHVGVTADCNSIECQFDADRDWIIRQGSPSGFGRMFHGKIKIKDCHLWGDIYDIKKDDLDDEKLSKYKEKYPMKFMKLMRKYEHEPIVCRNWNRSPPEEEEETERFFRVLEDALEDYDIDPRFINWFKTKLKMDEKKWE